jgi:MSHA biogenesis protein MshL
MLEPGNKKVNIGHLGGGSVLVNETGVSDIAGDTYTLDPAEFPFVPVASSAFGGVFTLALDLTDFTAFIELLKTQGNVQILSSPRVATMNNQKAVIKVGQDEFFVTDVSTTTVTGTTTTVQPNVTLTPFFSGIALDVTPQISDMGDVTLHIHPSISDVVDQQKTVVIGNVTQQLPLALSTVRETDSIVRAKSGQVVVLGGLMSDVTDDQQAATPGLSEVPLVGELFKHTRNRTLKTELVILLRPIVVDDGENWTGAIQQSGESLRKLRETLNDRGNPSLRPGSSDSVPH